jgi:TolB-like protein
VSGLAAAHAAGVVHRDLKPANIMIDANGEALIMDFGIARSTGTPAGPAPDAIPSEAWRTVGRHGETTMAGTIVGTVQYMAPEQARGLPVDQRADIYALGLILSDILLGKRRRWEGETALDELQRRMKEPPPALRSVDSHIPEAVDRLVARCVQPDPAKRFQTTTDLVAALDRLDQNGIPLPLVRRLTPRMMVATAVVVIAMLGGTYMVTRSALAPPVQHEPVSVVIADFQNRTNDPAFDRTLEPVLKRALEGASFISAFDRNSIRGTLGVLPPDQLDAVAARELAVKQGLGVVLSGAIDRQGDGYGITVKAVQTVTGNTLASADDTAANKQQVLEVATRLVTAVRTALGDEASESDQILAMASLSVTSLDVVRLYSGGQDAASKNQFDKALESFSEASSAGSQVRPRLPEHGRRVSQSGQAAGRAEVQQRGAPLSGRDDRAGALQHARDVLPDYGRLSALREGIRGADRSLRRRRGGAQPARLVLVEAAKHAHRRR